MPCERTRIALRLSWALCGSILALACATTDELLEGDRGQKAIVRIVTVSQKGDWYTPWNTANNAQGSGSGFVIDGGVVMTNAHVVSDARMVLLFLHGDPTPHEARVVQIGHDCDLALVEPVEPGLLDGIRALSFGDLPELGSVVETFGYPTAGQQISATRGVVSRIEVGRYSHSGMDSHLSVQTDAAINPGNSGGPVVQRGRVVGVAFQAVGALENVGFFIPTEVIQHFLVDLEDGRYDGYPEAGLMWSKLENPAARRAMGLGNQSGVRVDLVIPGSSADGNIREGDVLVEVEGRAVANDGSVSIGDLRLNLMVLVDRLQSGDPVRFGIVRDLARMDVEFVVEPFAGSTCYRNPNGAVPRYYVYAGLVFVPLCRGTLNALGDAAEAQITYEHVSRVLAEPERLGREVIMLLRRLADPVNAQMSWHKQLIVERVNGRPILKLTDVVAAVEGNTEDFHLFEFGYFKRFAVIDRAEADRAHPRILQRFGVQKDRRL